MPLEDKCTEDIELFRLEEAKGASGALRRFYTKVGTVKAHVEAMSPVELLRLRLVATDISHMLWFMSDPGYDSRFRLRWRGVVMRPDGPAVDLHGLGRVWSGGAKTLSDDNGGLDDGEVIT